MSFIRSTTVALAAVSCALGSLLAQAAPGPEVIMAARHDESRPMREILAELAPSVDEGSVSSPYVVPNIFPKQSQAWQSEFIRDLARRNIQDAPTGVPAPSVVISALGLISGSAAQPGNAGTSVPPDTNGDLSPIHYIQWLNTRWAVFDKATGARITASAAGNSFWAGFGGRCQTTNAGDPIALWDDKAERWVMSQFTTGATASQCFAISSTSDPLGTYYRYEFIWPADHFGDYPHIGIWHDASGQQNAYTLVTHEFNTAGSAFHGAAFTALDREKMLAGQPAVMVRYPDFDAYGAQPVHMEGQYDAPAGSCPVFTYFDATAGDYLFWDLCVDWATPANSTISAVQRVASATPFVPNYNTIPQLGTTAQLDEFGSNLMYRASARAFPPGAPHAMSLVVNHSVQGDVEQSSVRWVHFDLRKSTDSFATIFANGFDEPAGPVQLVKSISDEGVYAPDSNHRWMGAINIDNSGNIGLGYSVSSSTLNPKLRITGRTTTDTAGTMRDEVDCTPATTGSQTGTFSGRGRWGDYASMSVDPSDECTFWFTGEYFATTSSGSWSTRICSFKFPECGLPNFNLVSETPARVEMCGTTPGPDPSWRILAGTYNGFSSPVTLALASPPAGTTANFSTTTIDPTPGLSTLTLNGGHGLASGEFAFTVTGTSGADVRPLNLEFGISSAAPAAPTLTAPADTAAGIKVRPTLTWSAVPGTLTYTVEVATDNAFTNIVASATVTGTTWASNVTLASTTTYFWRVRPANYCGDGATSAVRTFTTGTPGVCPIGTTTTIVFQDDVETGVNGWTLDGSGGTAWTQAAAVAGTGLSTTVWRVPNNTVTSDRGLISPAITIPPAATAVILSYDVFHKFEDDGPAGCWDAASMELKLGAGAFTYLPESRLFSDGYSGTISAGSPLAGRRAWCHINSPLGLRSIVDLDDAIGQTFQVKFRHTSDSNTGATAPNGMAIDNIRVETCTP